MDNKSYHYLIYHLDNSKFGESSVPGTETNTKYIFLIINHSITVYQKFKDEENKEGRQSVKRPGWRRKLLYMRDNTHIILYEPECISKGRINKNTL